MILHRIDNATPFAWFAFEKMAPGRTLFDVLIVKARVPLSHDTRSAPTALEHARPSPIHYADLPRTSELGAYAPLHETTDLVLGKPATDFWLSGCARPAKPGTREWVAEVKLLNADSTQRYNQSLVFSGPRTWQWSVLKGWGLSRSEPVDALPLHYELAYGGSYVDNNQWHHYPDNPAGRGWMPQHRLNTGLQHAAAQIECLDSRLQDIETPIGVPALGPVARPWHARQQYAGSYDQAWHEQPEHPLGRDYPADFNLHFFQAAPSAQQFTPYLAAGTCLTLTGFTGDIPCYGCIPDWYPAIQAPGADRPTPLLLDTVVADLDNLCLHLTWRAPIPQFRAWASVRIVILNQ